MSKIPWYKHYIFSFFIHFSCSGDSETMWLYFFNAIWKAMFLIEIFQVHYPIIRFPFNWSWLEHLCWLRIFNNIWLCLFSWRLFFRSWSFLFFWEKLFEVIFYGFECIRFNFYNSFGRLFIYKSNQSIAFFIWFHIENIFKFKSYYILDASSHIVKKTNHGMYLRWILLSNTKDFLKLLLSKCDMWIYIRYSIFKPYQIFKINIQPKTLQNEKFNCIKAHFHFCTRFIWFCKLPKVSINIMLCIVTSIMMVF